MGQHPTHQLGQLVRKVDAQVAAEDDLVGFIGSGHLDAFDGAQLASADAHGLVPQGLHLGGGQRFAQDDVPVAVVAADQPAAAVGRLVGGHGGGRLLGSLGHDASVGVRDRVENAQRSREAIRS